VTPALGVTAAASECDHDTGCITCGDRAEQARVLSLDEALGLALCAGEDGSTETVEVALVAPVAPGDILLVHAGTAIANVGDAAA